MSYDGSSSLKHRTQPLTPSLQLTVPFGGGRLPAPITRSSGDTTADRSRTTRPAPRANSPMPGMYDSGVGRLDGTWRGDDTGDAAGDVDRSSSDTLPSIFAHGQLRRCHSASDGEGSNERGVYVSADQGQLAGRGVT